MSLDDQKIIKFVRIYNLYLHNLICERFRQIVHIKNVAFFELFEVRKKLCRRKTAVRGENRVRVDASDRKTRPLKVPNALLEHFLLRARIHRNVHIDLRNLNVPHSFVNLEHSRILFSSRRLLFVGVRVPVDMVHERIVECASKVDSSLYFRIVKLCSLFVEIVNLIARLDIVIKTGNNRIHQNQKSHQKNCN